MGKNYHQKEGFRYETDEKSPETRDLDNWLLYYTDKLYISSLRVKGVPGQTEFVGSRST